MIADTLPSFHDAVDAPLENDEGIEPVEPSAYEVTNEEFIAAIFPSLPPGFYPAVTSVWGDPEDPAKSWKARPVKKGSANLDTEANNYVNCSSFKQEFDGSFNARKERYGACHFLMLDDIGTRVPFDRLKGFELSWLIETSPGNHQGGVILSMPMTDGTFATDMLNEFISAGLCDRGANEPMSRWARLPVAINGKPKHADADSRPFQCRLVTWNPDRRYRPEQLLDFLEALDYPKKEEPSEKENAVSCKKTSKAKYSASMVSDQKSSSKTVIDAIVARGLYKARIDTGKHDITCPWVDEHTDAVDNGTRYFEPSDEFPRGGFKCHHGHCADRHLRDLREFLGLQTTATNNKPRILVSAANPDITIAAMRDVLATHPGLYDRGVPVRVAYDEFSKGHVAHAITPESLVHMIHSVARPFAVDQGKEVDVRMPRSITTMYLDWRGEWNLKPLRGIAAAPILNSDGSIKDKKGYDESTELWAEVGMGSVCMLPDRPTRDEAAAALDLVRTVFKTFCFADAELVADYSLGPDAPLVVDTTRPPGRDESAFLAALMTAVCRPSLPLAPGILLRASPFSGAGAGKGLLARCMCLIAFGREPHAVTGGGATAETEKRIGAELMEGNPVLFLDNLNNTAFKSDLLASAITEKHARIRLLGQSRMMPLNSIALVILTGNGLTVSEDLARRFITIELDPGTEDPEARYFPNDIKAEVNRRREELQAAMLTIWRWGRQDTSLKRGKPLGSFEQWTAWVRDPLMALGCRDPVDQVREAKVRDSRRQLAGDIFDIWWARHRDQPVSACQLHHEVRMAIDIQNRGRQFIAAHLDKMSGTRLGGRRLTRQAPVGKWGKATYALLSEEHGQASSVGWEVAPS